jgi:hypothetical protein
MVTGFVILPASVLYALILLVMGLARGNLGFYFTLIHGKILGVAGGMILLALVLFIAFGKKLVVR